VPTARRTSLTGIKPTGIPHLGNYVGAIRPAVELSRSYDAFYFIADYHALTTARDPAELDLWTRAVAASWLASGLDPGTVTLYRQSDVPETFELQWILACVTSKGLMNRAHAYKAARDRNREGGAPDLDAGVSMGLFDYPVLMAADILVMAADVVPVGRDQVQHVEYARDMAERFNLAYGERFRLPLPEHVTPPEASGETLPGLDGRKMSKSYGNAIALMAEPDAMRKQIRRIVTDSKPPEEPKDPGDSTLVALLRAFAEPETVAAVEERFREGGIGYGEVKDLLADAIEAQVAPLRRRYESLLADGDELDGRLAAGERVARERAGAVLERTMEAMGL
jgi:tryptophanyl-tRNA synthetase